VKIGKNDVKIFKIKNRKGYAAVCSNHLTEGRTVVQAHDRLMKAIRRTSKKA